jgi:hypothetical protein
MSHVGGQFHQVRTITLPGPNPRPAEAGAWRRVAIVPLTARPAGLPRDKFIGQHPALIGEADKIVQPHADADGVASARVGKVQADHGFAVDARFGNANAALRPDFDDRQGPSPAEKPEPKA